MGWGLASSDEAKMLEMLMPDVGDAEMRRRIALRVQRRMLDRAHRFMRALDRPATPPSHLRLHLVAGDAEPTLERISVDSADGHLEDMKFGIGDGTVLRSSVLLDERVGNEWTPRLKSPLDFYSVLFLPSDHLGVTRHEVFRDNVLFWLLEEPRSP